MTFFMAGSPERHVRGSQASASVGAGTQPPAECRWGLAGGKRSCGVAVPQAAPGALCCQPCCALHSFYTFSTVYVDCIPPLWGGQ